MGHSRQAYYQGRRREADRLANAQAVVELVREQRMRQPRIGTRKLHYLISVEVGVPVRVGRDRLFSILRNARELVARKRAYHKTTDSHHRFRRPDALACGRRTYRPDGQTARRDVLFGARQRRLSRPARARDGFAGLRKADAALSPPRGEQSQGV